MGAECTELKNVPSERFKKSKRVYPSSPKKPLMDPFLLKKKTKQIRTWKSEDGVKDMYMFI